MVLFFMELSTRKVEIAGIGAAANGLWMRQIGRNLIDAVDGVLNGKRYPIHDRDPLFTTEFLEMLADVGVKSVKLPPRSPNLNAHAERRSIEIHRGLQPFLDFTQGLRREVADPLGQFGAVQRGHLMTHGETRLG